MKQFTLVVLFLTFTMAAVTASAQSKSDNIASAKVAFLTDKMALTPEQAQKFWPVYNEYESKRREIMRTRMNKGKPLENISDQELLAMVDNMFERRQKELDLEQEYAAKYKRIITPKQLVIFYRAEHEFTKLLLKRLDSNQGRAKND